MNLSAPDTLFLVVGLIDVGGIFICASIGIYLGYTKNTLFLKLFKNSRSLIPPDAMISGPYAKLRLTASISLALTFPRFFMKRGLSAHDLENFPPYLRRKLVALNRTMLGLSATMLILGALVTLGLLD